MLKKSFAAFILAVGVLTGALLPAAFAASDDGYGQTVFTQRGGDSFVLSGVSLSADDPDGFTKITPDDGNGVKTVNIPISGKPEYVKLEATLRIDTASQRNILIGNNNGSARNFILCFAPNLTIKYDEGQATDGETPTYNLGEEQNVVIYIRYGSGEGQACYSAEVNGVTICRNRALPALTQVNDLRIGVRAAAANNPSIFVKDVKVSVPQKMEIKSTSFDWRTHRLNVTKPIEIVFTTPQDEEKCKAVITMKKGDQTVDISVAADKNTVTVTPSEASSDGTYFDFDTDYTLKISAELTDSFNQKLSGEDISYTLHTVKRELCTDISFDGEASQPTAQLWAFNPTENELRGTLYLAVYDGNRMIALEKKPIVVPPSNGEVTENISKEITDFDAAAAFFIGDDGMHCGSAAFLNFVPPVCALEADAVTITSKKTGDGDEIADADYADDTLAFAEGAVNAKNKTELLIKATNENGDIIYISPVYTDENGVFTAEFDMQGTDIDIKMNITASGPGIENQASEALWYASPQTKAAIVSDINAAASAVDIESIITGETNRYAEKMNINLNRFSKNTYDVLFKLKNFGCYDEIYSAVQRSYNVLKAVNEAQWNERAALITTNADLISDNDERFDYFKELESEEQNKILKEMSGTYADFAELLKDLYAQTDIYKEGISTPAEKPENKKSNFNAGGGGTKTIAAPISGGSEAKTEENEKFTDLSNAQWAQTSIYFLLDKKIIAFPEDKQFRPEDCVTREEFVKMLAQMMGISLKSGELCFSDMEEDAWYTPYLTAAKEAGIITGNADGSFGVGQSITRQDMMVMARRGVAAMGKELKTAEKTETFSDENDISDYARDAIKNMTDAGIVNGMGDGRIAPRENLSRAQAAQVIYKMYININGGIAQ